MNPLVSVIIPTLDSGKTIEETLISLKKQSFDPSLIEVIVIDGGSKDKTLSIAINYGCTILKNKKKQQEYAKHIGLLNAKGRYLMFLDSDEVLESTFSLKNRLALFYKNKSVKILFSSGYKQPKKYSLTNDYINTFGDPFSYYMYGISPNYFFFINDFKKRHKNYHETKDYCIFFFSKNETLPLIDLCAGTIIEKKYLNNKIKLTLNNAQIVPTVPYVLMSTSKSIAILKDDPIVHNSANNLKKYLNKLSWKVLVNVHYKNLPGTGFSNRENFQPISFAIKKYFFILFALTLIGPLLISFYFFIFRKKSIALLLHLPLTIYVAFCIIIYYFLNLLGIKPNLFVYGKVKK